MKLSEEAIALYQKRDKAIRAAYDELTKITNSRKHRFTIGLASVFFF